MVLLGEFATDIPRAWLLKINDFQKSKFPIFPSLRALDLDKRNLRTALYLHGQPFHPGPREKRARRGSIDDALRGSASKQSQQTINSADARACGVKFSFCEIPLNYTFLVSWAAIQFFKNSFVVMRIAVS